MTNQEFGSFIRLERKYKKFVTRDIRNNGSVVQLIFYTFGEEFGLVLD